MQRATAHWLATRNIETALCGDELVAWIPAEHLADFYDLVYGGGGNTQKKVLVDGGARKLTPIEYERCKEDNKVTHNGEHFCFFCSYCGKRLEVEP